ncbi:MAG: GIY-YIG nuclease family protein [Patescibacteria group bacterium]|nr:GIY-YIG nuclease family protein [Patescibacteria group bacterium]
MFYIYLLKSRLNNGFCVGFTPDLKSRLLKHNRGDVLSTKRYLPRELMYYEAYKSKKDAVLREKQLKRFAKSFSMLKRRLKYSLVFQG